MIRIYIKSWNLNAEDFGSSEATKAAELLAARGFEVQLEDAFSPDGNSGCECDTEEEYEVVNNV